MSLMIGTALVKRLVNHARPGHATNEKYYVIHFSYNLN